MVHRVEMSMRAFSEEKIQTTISNLREDYFKEIYLSGSIFYKYLEDHNSSNYLTSRQDIQQKILKLHTILYDK